MAFLTSPAGIGLIGGIAGAVIVGIIVGMRKKKKGTTKERSRINKIVEDL